VSRKGGKALQVKKKTVQGRTNRSLPPQQRETKGRSSSKGVVSVPGINDCAERRATERRDDQTGGRSHIMGSYTRDVSVLWKNAEVDRERSKKGGASCSVRESRKSCSSWSFTTKGKRKCNSIVRSKRRMHSREVSSARSARCNKGLAAKQ